ncbi:hypothetical protein BGZ65_008954, partial [Modicella reniformis]
MPRTDKSQTTSSVNLHALVPKGPKEPRRVNLAQKREHLQEWLRHVERFQAAGLGNVPQMRRYEGIRGFPENYIARLLKMKDRLENMPTSIPFNLSVRPFFPVETLLVKLIDEIRNQCITIDHQFLRIMAQEIYTLLLDQVGSLNFDRPSFSLSWVYKFREHWKLLYFKTKGEAGMVDMKKIGPEVGIISEYSLEDVYNADETVL